MVKQTSEKTCNLAYVTRCKLYDTETSNLVCIILFKAIFYLEKNKQFYIQKSWLAI